MSSCKEISLLRILPFSDNKYFSWRRGTAPRQIGSSDATDGSPGDPPQPLLGMKFSSVISLFSAIILAHSPPSLLPPLLWGAHVQLVPQALGRLHSLLGWADRSAMPRGRWGRDNSRLCLLRQARTEAQRQLSLSGKKPVRAFFQLLRVFLLLFWAEWKKQQGDPALWPQEDHWPIYEEIHLIWLHTSLTSVKGGGVLGLVFAFWFFCKETLHVNAKEALSFKAVALTS